jgi:hypothetical protein
MRYGSQAGVPGAPGNMGVFGGNSQNGRDIVEETRARQFPYFIPPSPGSSNVAGAVGNMGGMMVGQMPPPIDPAAHREQMRQKKIYDKGRGTDNPNERDTFLRRTGPQLPLAQAGGINVLNNSMFGGPQMGQAVPDGFVNKYVS